MRPIFLARKVVNTGHCRIVKDQHIKFSVRQGKTTMTGIGFGLAHKFHILELDEPIDIVFTLETNTWQNQTTLQMKVIDIKLSWG
jgi:single-stranded-DNA-specific exonuclease